MQEVYKIIGQIKNHFKQDLMVNTVKFGDIKEVDLDKTTIFPLTHFWLERAGFQGRTLSFTLNFMFLDIVNQSKTVEEDEYGQDNLLDVLNEQWAIANRFLVALLDYRGTLASQQYVLLGEPEANMLYEEMENKLAGWGISITIEVPNDKYDACQI